MDYLPLTGAVVLAHALAVISPGPDFLVAVRHALIYSRRTGLWTAAGFAAGVAVHVAYCLAGLALLISQSVFLFTCAKLAAAGYLIYLGIQSWRARSVTASESSPVARRPDIRPLAALRVGFLTNVLNPKVTLFFLGLFTLVITPDLPVTVLAGLSAVLIVNTFAWFALVAVFFGQARVRQAFDRCQSTFNKICGALLIALGLRVGLSQQ